MSANSKILDGLLRHDVGLRRVEARLVRDIIALLNAADADIVEQVAVRLAKIVAKGYDPSPDTTKRLEALLKEVRLTAKAAYERMGYFLRKELKDIAAAEVDFHGELFSRATGGALRDTARRGAITGSEGVLEVSYARLPMNQIVTMVEHTPVQGRFLSQWVADLSEDKVRQVNRALQLGMVEGESVDQIVRRLRGTKAAGYTDGVLDISRRHAETWIRTSFHEVANRARDGIYGANADILKGVVWVSTLDSRACEQCVPRDGLLYDLEHKPVGHSMPWAAGPGRLHPNDRCTSVPELKSWKELGLDLEEAPEGTRASLDGPVPAKTTVEDLYRKNPAWAVELYGKERADLFLRGGVSAQDLLRKDGTLWTLKELRERERTAYERLGLAA